MLLIRDAQMDVFARERRQEFVRQLAARISRILEHHDGGQALIAPIGNCMERGRRYGLVAERDLYLFASMAAILGWDFDRAPEISQVLTDANITSPSRRLYRVLDIIKRRLEQDEFNRQVEEEFNTFDSGRYAAASE